MIVWSKTYEFYTMQMEPVIQTKMNVARKLKPLSPQNRREAKVLRLGKRRFKLDNIFILRCFKK